jgi:hypothetical protein
MIMMLLILLLMVASEATVKMGNAAPFLVKNASRGDINDLEGDEEKDDSV